MDNLECVRVALNIRPLITSELLIGCTDCISVVPGEPQVQIGSHSFTFDHVYNSSCSSLPALYDDCVAPLVDALFHGYNTTVLAYGQTGSGKTYTMGTNYSGENGDGGIISRVMESIFDRVKELENSTEFLIRVSFIEIFKEEVFDLLDPNSSFIAKGDGINFVKPMCPTRVPIQIREAPNGGITLTGVIEPEVRSKHEMISYLLHGSSSRATGSTNMNSQSSRSHAIFTITLEQKKIANCQAGVDDIGDCILISKLHLVDLAGSERAKRTGADGLRFKEGIHINKGLLALGNVISALGDDKKRKEGGHVPYRDSKLTRLLQDSLGGNSKTVMIACISPAETNAEETLNTLKYANRARNIQNKAIMNRDPVAAQMQKMRSQIDQLQAELVFCRGDGRGAPFDELQILKRKVSLLEASNDELRRRLKENQETYEHLSQHATDAQIEKDKLIIKIEAARNGKTWDEIESNSDEVSNLMKNYVSRIQELEMELLSMKNILRLKQSQLGDHGDSDDEISTLNEISSNSEAKTLILSDVVEDEEKELEHSSLQERLDMELKELDRKLEQKEAEMKHFANVDTSVLKQHFEKKVQELEQEKRILLKEIEELRYNLANIASTSSDDDDDSEKLKENYLQKLTFLETQVADLKKKQEAQAQLLRQKQKSDEATKKLQEEIQRIKTQKVQLQQKIKQESEQFRMWKVLREKEVLQLKKEGRRNEYEMHKLLALNQKQKMVLHRKTEEAAMATKRLKELLESRKASGAGNGNGPGMQALIHAIEHELEVTLQVHEVRSEYGHQIEERARMAKEIAKLKEEANVLKQTNMSDFGPTMSPGARNSRIFALESMLATSSSTMVSMASQLSEAEERERGFIGRGRWNQIRSLSEAKNIMNHLFNLAFSSRCSLRDKEADCREKSAEMRDLKEKVVKLSGLVQHLEMKKAELIQQVKAEKSELKQYFTRFHANPEAGMPDVGRRKYDLRKQEPRCSMILLEEMDVHESEHTETEDDADWVESDRDDAADDGSAVLPVKRRARKAVPSNEGGNSQRCCNCRGRSKCMKKCRCRAAGATCGPQCKCQPEKCTNREAVAAQQIASRGGPGAAEEKMDQALVSHGTLLLQTALNGIPAKILSDGASASPRKPLVDIGNIPVLKSNAKKPKRKKKSRSVVRLVSVAASASDSANTETHQLTDDHGRSGDPNINLPLPPPHSAPTAAASRNGLSLKPKKTNHLPPTAKASDENVSLDA